MSEHDDEREQDAPRTAAEAQGSIVDRLRHPLHSSGEPRHAAGDASEGPASRLRRRPVRRVRDAIETTDLVAGTQRKPLLEESYSASAGGHELDPADRRRAENLVAGLFFLSLLGTIGFCLFFFFTHVTGSNLKHLLIVNAGLGLGLTVSLAGIGLAFIVWAKRLLPHEKAVQEREPFHSVEEDELATENLLIDSITDTGIGRRRLMIASFVGAMAAFPLTFLFAARDLGPSPDKRLRKTAWQKGSRLVDHGTGQPIKLGDLPIGGYVTVMPEGHNDADTNALAPTMLIRLRAGENVPAKGRADWAAYDHVAYSAVCTHAGCPAKLYEQQTHHILCPCHQSTFDVIHACKVVFGPAARALPQLPIYVDSDGYFRAKGGYAEPVGPSFWERG